MTPASQTQSEEPQGQQCDLRVCIVAENASFRFGGEASLPLHYFARLRARRMEAWLVVHGRTRKELESLFPEEQDRIQYIPDRWYHKLIWKLSRLLPRRVSEATLGTLMVLINQLIQREMVRTLIRERRVNLVHQPIPVSPKAPSFIGGLGVPVVLGPMNGGMDYPAAFRAAESWFTRSVVALGRSGAELVNRIVPGKRNADIVLVANERTRLALPACVRGKILEIPENGVDLGVWCDGEAAQVRKGAEGDGAKFLFMGRLVDWKRLDLVLDALAQVAGAELVVIGDGPMRAMWTAHSEALGIAARVRFLGWLPQAECAAHLRRATALLLPSIYECGGAVVLEAMAAGVPAVATAWGGPADYLDASCGILVDPTSAETIRLGFVSAMRVLSSDPELCAQLGAAGRRRVEEHFDWNKKIDRMLDIFREALHGYRG
jgi:glycosyltransferase involved in cell wall biosynthesis